MKRWISLLVVVLTMTLGLSPPTFAAPDFGTENQFTIEQADLDMDITIDMIIDFVPVAEAEIIPEPIYLEGVVIIYPHMEEGYMFKLDQTALIQQYTRYRHDLCSTGLMVNQQQANETPEIFLVPATLIEGPMRLELYSDSGTWPFRETYS